MKATKPVPQRCVAKVLRPPPKNSTEVKGQCPRRGLHSRDGLPVCGFHKKAGNFTRYDGPEVSTVAHSDSLSVKDYKTLMAALDKAEQRLREEMKSRVRRLTPEEYLAAVKQGK